METSTSSSPRTWPNGSRPRPDWRDLSHGQDDSRLPKSKHLETRHPFIDRISPIVLAEYVTTDAGTGCVHTAPGHGLDDYQTGLKYGLEIYCPIDDQGRYIDDGQVPADLVGLSVLETKGWSDANKAVLKYLETTGTLVKLSKLRHSYPHCWRSKTPVIFRAMDQWFISVDQNDLQAKGTRGDRGCRVDPGLG